MLEIDKTLLAGPETRGFKLDSGPEGGGHQMKVRQNHGGYYLNEGCSDLIVDGQVGLLHHEDIDRFVQDGALMKDGHVEKTNPIVAATDDHPP